MKVIGNKSEEWYTPPELLDLIYQVMDVDLDPASPYPPSVLARRHYDKKSNGLIKPWFGNVYLNPPYGRNINQWISKLCDEWEQFHINNAVVLIPNKTDTKWFFDLAQHARCFCTITGRIKFLSDHSNYSSGTFGNLLVLLTDDEEMVLRFVDTFSDKGIIWKHYYPLQKRSFCQKSRRRNK